jgi:hypothetical protein
MTKYLNKTTRGTLSSVRISEYPLPYDTEIIVRVKSQPMSRMNRHADATEAGGQRARTSTIKLLSESIVDEADVPVWSASEVELLLESDCRLVSALMKMIVDHNGGNDSDVEKMLGNLDQTE